MKDTPVEELKTKPTLRAHAFGFMKELSGLVENIEAPEELLCALQANARRHQKRGVSTKDYEVEFIWNQILDSEFRDENVNVQTLW